MKAFLIMKKHPQGEKTNASQLTDVDGWAWAQQESIGFGVLT